MYTHDTLLIIGYQHSASTESMNPEFYGRYKYVRNKTWKFLSDYQIKELPISIMSLFKKMNVRVASYQNGLLLLRDLDMEFLCDLTEGFTIFINEKWYVFYNDKIEPRQRIRFTLAHELGHFVLGHKMQTKDANRGTVFFTTRNDEHWINDPLEFEANIFASRVLAPACVLWGLGISTALEIGQLCGLSKQASEIRSERMQFLYDREKHFIKTGKRGPFLLHPDEQHVFAQFEPFINRTKSRH